MQQSLFNIPDKAMFRPEEVVRLTRLDSRVLMFWAREFDGISPRRQENGESLYSKSAVERILTIKQLLVEERLDKEGVRQRLKEPSDAPPKRVTEELVNAPAKALTTLGQIKQGLKEILTMLDRGDRL